MTNANNFSPHAPLVMSMGEVGGSGPEIALKLWAQSQSGVMDCPPFCLLADPDFIAARAKLANISVPISIIDNVEKTDSAWANGLPILPLKNKVSRYEAGITFVENAPAIIEAIELGTGLCLAGKASALVTLPISKAPLQQAGFGFPGHTEFLAELAPNPLNKPSGPVMLLASDKMKVALVTIHQPLASVSASLSVARIINTARVLDADLREKYGIMRPKIGLCGLNPHAGEDGHLGNEEIEIINPAAQACRQMGIDISNAIPADSLFHEEARSDFDVLLAIYHDQGLIPFKMASFWDGVNVTLGINIIRTSPDHGTAFGLAGTGKARIDSTLAALKMASEMSAEMDKQSGAICP